jgi:hypothetical protein
LDFSGVLQNTGVKFTHAHLREIGTTRAITARALAGILGVEPLDPRERTITMKIACPSSN